MNRAGPAVQIIDPAIPACDRLPRRFLPGVGGWVLAGIRHWMPTIGVFERSDQVCARISRQYKQAGRDCEAHAMATAARAIKPGHLNDCDSKSE